MRRTSSSTARPPTFSLAALFFAWHVFWPRGAGGGVDAVALAIASAATLALFRFRRGVVETIAACGVIGLVLRFAWPG